MVKKKDLLILLAVVVTTAAGSLPVLAATTYYVSSSSGSDTNNGTTEATPWKTIYKVNQQAFVAGDKICFKRGDTWRLPTEQVGGRQLIPDSGNASAYIIYTDYGTDPNMPLFLGSVEKNNTVDWSRPDPGNNPNVWVTANNSFSGLDIGNLIFNNETFCGHHKRWTTGDLNHQGDFYYDITNDRVELYSSSDPADYYSDIECAVNKKIIDIAGKTYVVIENLDLRYGGAHGIWIRGNSNNIIVRDNDLSYIGGSAQNATERLRYGNGIEVWNSAQDVRVERNRVWEIYDAALTNQGNGTTAVQNNIHFQYNVVWNSTYSFEYLSSAATMSVDNIYVENNTFVNAGDGWPYVQVTEGDQNRGFSIRFWGSYNNANRSIITNFNIRNNIIYQNNNNAFLGPENRCFILPTDIPELDLNNNSWYFYNWNVPTAGLIDYLGTVYTVSGFSDYQTATGWDSNSIVASIAPDDANDPNFVDIASNNYRLQAGSPCIDIGWDVGLTQDFDLNPIVPAGYPDIGAFEYQTPPVAYWPMDENEGGTVYDETPYNNDGTIYGATWTTDSRVGPSALSFNGVNAHVKVYHSPSTNFTTGLTVEAWVKYDSFLGTCPVVSDWNIWAPGAQKGFTIGTYDGSKQPQFAVADGVNYYTVGSSELFTTVGKWYHIAGTFDNGIMKIYVNGNQQGSKTISATSIVVEDSTPIVIGASGLFNGRFKGTIDEIRLYDVALTYTQINQVYNNAP